MVSVNGKEMIFGTWFTIENEGSAVVDLPMAPGFTMRLEILQWPGEDVHAKGEAAIVERMNWEQQLHIKMNDKEVHVLMPYLMQYKAEVASLGFDLLSVGKVTGHLVRQQVQGAMLVHLALYLERT